MECQSYVFYIISPYNSNTQSILKIENLNWRDMEGNRDIWRKKIHFSYFIYMFRITWQLFIFVLTCFQYEAYIFIRWLVQTVKLLVVNPNVRENRRCNQELKMQRHGQQDTKLRQANQNQNTTKCQSEHRTSRGVSSSCFSCVIPI